VGGGGAFDFVTDTTLSDNATIAATTAITKNISSIERGERIKRKEVTSYL
jgi:hypothetical protein